MPNGQHIPTPQEIARKWLDLAERRIASYQELYRTGRWRHYFANEQEFAVRMLEVIQAAKTFSRVAGIKPPSVQAREHDLAA